MSIWAFYLAVLRRFPVGILAANGLQILASVLEMVGLAAVILILSRFFEGAGATGGPFGVALGALGLAQSSLESLLLILSGMIVARSALGFAALSLVGRVAITIERGYRHELMGRYLQADWQFHLEQNAGRVTNLITRETRRARSAVIEAGNYYANLLMAGVFCLAALLVSWQALAIAVVIGAALVLASIRVNRLSRRAGASLVTANSRFSGSVIESINLAKYIKGSAAEHQILEKFDRAIDEVAILNFKQILYREFIRNYPDVIGVFVISIVVYLAHAVIGGVDGNLLFFLLLAQRASSRVATMQNARRMTLQDIPSYEACMALLAEAGERREDSGGRPFGSLRDRIELRGVGFSYPNAAAVLRGVDLQIAKSSMVALVGRSGGGKTTLVDMILGLLRPTQGAILVDGEDLWSYDIAGWRRRVGFVPQDPVLFDGSVAANIVITCPSASDEQIREAARMANATAFIDDLPRGYDTIVGDRGIKLSGGQKQRIALARALVRDPEILILDEATSALDTESEQKIQQAILSLKGRITVIVIAHRLSTVEKADRIFVIKDGQVSEAGSFAELQARGGEFAKLHTLGR